MHSTTLHVLVNSKEIANTDIQNWEKKRAYVVLKKLGVASKSDDLFELRKLLIKRKIELGQDKIKLLLKNELRISDVVAKLTAKLSFGYRRFSVTEIFVENAKAEHFVNWFEQCSQANDEIAMLAGTPDHYVISTNNDGLQEVIETNGGSPLPARFYIDYEDLSSLKSEIDLTYPLQIAGVARTQNGLAIGGVRHQFRNEANGFRAKLTVEYPLLILPTIISGHQWHLANEFSNWILLALNSD
ncbi:hypothetical protein F966_03162 [Acinetobacter higginsii]|uniref:Uncharacterized protein n=1 Tax=Acinetobacter higginsii TaxID=70347 RepID=N8XM09_9GAMM|nr:hypothetical protein [Acinetobacter higginsii]ENV08488.1 hypothetical protein F966_03162 [Acinetobacter higginsii]